MYVKSVTENIKTMLWGRRRRSLGLQQP